MILGRDSRYRLCCCGGVGRFWYSWVVVVALDCKVGELRFDCVD